MLESIKLKNFSYPQIFDQQSLKTYAERQVIQNFELKTVLTNIYTVHFVFIIEEDALPSQTS